MDVIVIMCIGVLAGKFLLPCNLNRWNQILQVVCTLFLIFSMGVLLGSREKLSGRTFYIGNSECDFLFAAVCGIGSSGLSSDQMFFRK